MLHVSVHSRGRAVVVLIAVVAIVGALWRSAGTAGAQGDIHVVLQTDGGRTTFLDFGATGLRLGDRLAARGLLLDATQTDQVGVANLDCVVHRRIAGGTGGVYRCSYLLRLPDGDLVMEGFDPHGPGVSVFAVLGGTETYASAAGSATLTDTESETDIVIDLI